jgi:hypothetical protein
MGTLPSVLDALEARLTPEAIQEISSKLGTDTSTIANAISMVVPILLGGLSTKAADADGAAALDAGLDNVLPHILGDHRRAVEEGIGRAAGLDTTKVGELLTLVAPIIMRVLAEMKRTQDVGADELPAVLGQASLDMARQSAAIGDLSRVLSSDDALIADEIARAGSSIVGGMLGRDASS